MKFILGWVLLLLLCPVKAQETSPTATMLVEQWQSQLQQALEQTRKLWLSQSSTAKKGWLSRGNGEKLHHHRGWPSVCRQVHCQHGQGVAGFFARASHIGISERDPLGDWWSLAPQSAVNPKHCRVVYVAATVSGSPLIRIDKRGC